MIGSFPDSTAPEGDKTAYYSVKPTAAAFVAQPGVSYNYFGLYWGTIDEYNELPLELLAPFLDSVRQHCAHLL